MTRARLLRLRCLKAAPELLLTPIACAQHQNFRAAVVWDKCDTASRRALKSFADPASAAAIRSLSDSHNTHGLRTAAATGRCARPQAPRWDVCRVRNENADARRVGSQSSSSSRRTRRAPRAVATPLREPTVCGQTPKFCSGSCGNFARRRALHRPEAFTLESSRGCRGYAVRARTSGVRKHPHEPTAADARLRPLLSFTLESQQDGK